VSRTPDFPQSSFGPKCVPVETLESEYCETDADGFFTADRLIPSVEYDIRIYSSKSPYRHTSLKMPILQPEQYQQPYSLGDVVMSAAPLRR